MTRTAGINYMFFHFPQGKNAAAPIQFFFAPSAVRPNSPVTVEQKHDPSPLMAKTPINAGADDRIPPSQECSPHPGRKQQGKQQNTTSEKRQNW